MTESKTSVRLLDMGTRDSNVNHRSLTRPRRAFLYPDPGALREAGSFSQAAASWGRRRGHSAKIHPRPATVELDARALAVLDLQDVFRDAGQSHTARVPAALTPSVNGSDLIGEIQRIFSNVAVVTVTHRPDVGLTITPRPATHEAVTRTYCPEARKVMFEPTKKNGRLDEGLDMKLHELPEGSVRRNLYALMDVLKIK